MEYKCSNIGIWYSRNRKETELDLCKKYGITDIVKGKFFEKCRKNIHRVLYVIHRDSGEYQFIINIFEKMGIRGVK